MSVNGPLMAQPPPAYSADPSTAQSAPAYDATSSLTAQFTNLNLTDLESSDGFPTVGQAIAHLELLNAINNLRSDIKSRDGLFDLCDSDANSKTTIEEIREKRWAVYVTQAVERFRIWWDSLSLMNNGERLKVRDTRPAGKDSYMATFTAAAAMKTVTKQDELPPLDVLMVWHSFKLNPRCYLEDCIRSGNVGLFYTEFPWTAIHASMDATSGSYNPGHAAEQSFESLTGLSWSKILSHYRLTCPIDHKRNVGQGVPARTSPINSSNAAAAAAAAFGHSSHALPRQTHDGSIDVQWTTCGAELRTSGSSMPTGKGFADPGFEVTCPTCSLKIDHEQLRAAKFMSQSGLVNGLVQTYPDSDDAFAMGGTVLADDGVFRTGGTAPGEFATLVIAAMLRRWQPTGKWYSTMQEVRSDIEATMKDRKTIKSILKLSGNVANRDRVSTHFASPAERATIRRLMSRFWDNSSPFALDLVGAVIRQGVFITKMADLDWLNSPAVSSTTARLITKYNRFMQLMARYSSQLLVPTLDVDLAWHTHQLSSRAYYAFTVAATTKFIDHDDKIAEDKLSTAFAETTSLYQNKFKEPYSECLCWYCEAIRASHAPTTGLFKKKIVSTEAEKQLYAHAKERELTDDPSKGCHISTHNAISPNQHSYLTDKAQKKLDKDFEKAVKRALQEGRKPPKRDNSVGDAYGYGFAFYPFPMPFGYGYAYGGDGAGVYVTNPGCGTFTQGAAGNCAVELVVEVLPWAHALLEPEAWQEVVLEWVWQAAEPCVVLEEWLLEVE